MNKLGWVIIVLFVGAVHAWLFSGDNGVHPTPVRVELTPEVRYHIQKEVQREIRRLTKPVLPMVAPNPKVKVKR